MIRGGAPALLFLALFRICRRFPDGRCRTLFPSCPALRSGAGGPDITSASLPQGGGKLPCGISRGSPILGLGRTGHPDRARGRAGHRQPRFHLHPHLAPVHAGAAPPGLLHRPRPRARHAPGAAFRHRLDRQSDRAPGHDLRQGFFLEGLHPHGRRHLFLLLKGTMELHERLEGGMAEYSSAPTRSGFWQVIVRSWCWMPCSRWIPSSPRWAWWTISR